jgi:hypothetical protein
VSGGEEVDTSPLDDFDFLRPMIVSAWGRKGSGKSYGNRRLFRSWPLDRLVIDVNGNSDPGEDTEDISPDDIPPRFPEAFSGPGERPRARSLRLRAHPGSPTYRDDLDRAVGMALYPQRKRVLLWAGECGELMPHGKPGNHMRTLLMQNRHYNVSALFDGPRPVYVDPLTLAQSDLVMVYELPNPNDRKRIADEIGFPPKQFDRECNETWRRGKHWFLLWHAGEQRLFRHPPLPAEEEEKAA